MNHKKLGRLYAEERLQVSPWRTQARVGHAGADDAAAGAEPALVAGLCVGHADQSPAVPHPGGGANTSLSGARVARELTMLIARRGARPLLCVSDNGTELTSTAILSPAPTRRSSCRTARCDIEHKHQLKGGSRTGSRAGNARSRPPGGESRIQIPR